MAAAGLLAGAALGLASAELTSRIGGRKAVAGAGLGLVVAAAIYPAARRSLGSGGLGAELATLGATSAVAGTALGAAPASGRRLVAVGWAAHALFDGLQGTSPDSRLPAWYPALCAGYDLAFAARLAR
jgi:hypothetical protein